MEEIGLLDRTNQGDIAAALDNLAEVFEYTVVDRCPVRICEVCGHRALPAAA